VPQKNGEWQMTRLSKEILRSKKIAESRIGIAAEKIGTQTSFILNDILFSISI
jgi:hypothetical protein